MAKQKGEPRTRTRVRYMQEGNAILGGEHAPVYVHPKQRLKNAPTGEGAVANVGSLFDIGAGAVHLGLSAVFTPRKVVGAVKRGWERDVEKEKHRIKYDSAVSPVFEGMIKKEEGYREERIPSNQLKQQQLRRAARGVQGEYENGKWVANEEYEQNRVDRNEKVRKDNLKAEVIGLPPVDRWNKKIPLATRQNIKLYPDVEALEKQEREYGQKIMTKEEALEIIKKRSDKNTPINGIFRRIRSVQYNGKKFSSKQDVVNAIARHDVALITRMAAKTPTTRREPESRFGLKPYPQRNQRSAYILDNPLMYETSLKWRKPSEQIITTHYKETGKPVSGGIKTSYIPTFENISLNVSSKRSELTESELKEDRETTSQKYKEYRRKEQNIKTSFEPVSQNIKTSYNQKSSTSTPSNISYGQEIQRAFRSGLKNQFKNNNQNIKTSYKPSGFKPVDDTKKKKSFRFITDTWQGYKYPKSKFDVFTFGGKEYPDVFKKDVDERDKYRMRSDTHEGKRTSTGFEDVLKSNITTIKSKQNIKTGYTTPNFTIEPIFDHFGIFSQPKKSPVKKSPVKKVSPPKTTKKHPYISAADQDKIDAQKAAKYRSEKAKKGGKK
jgi:hypothetical protein